MYTKTNIGSRIKERRNALGLTQKELAAKINGDILPEDAPHTQISQWEHQDKTPETDALIRLCNALDCDIDFLLGQIDVPRRDTADVMAATGLTEESIAVIDTLSKDDMQILNYILASPHFLELISSISKGAESPKITGDLVTGFMIERIGGSKNKTLLDAIHKIIPEDIYNIFKFEATDAAGKLFDAASDILYERRTKNG